MYKLISTILLSISMCNIFSQSKLTGKISDESNNPISFSTLKVKDESIGSKSDVNGAYTLVFPKSGTYKLIISNIGFTTEEATITINENQTLEKNFSLKSSSKKVKNVTVTGQKTKSTETATLEEQKQSTKIIEVMGTQEMSRKGASSAGAAVTKMAGISKSEGSSQIYVRGLGDRYNSTTLNGMFLPSDNPEFKNISLDYFPIEVIRSIGVSKTFNNTLFGDFGGATIDIATKEFTGKPYIATGLKIGANSQALTNTILGSGMDYIGTVSNTEKPVINTNTFFSPEWNGTERSQPHINSEINLNGGWSKVLKNNSSLSLFGTGSISNRFEYFEGMTKTTNAQNANTDSSGRKSSDYLVNYNMMLNGVYKVSEKLKFKANYLFFRTAANQVNQYTGYDYNIGEENYKQRIIKNISKLNIYQFMTDYKHSERLNFNLGLAYNDISNEQPDRVTYEFVKINNKYIFKTDSKGDQNVYYQSLNDKDYTVNLSSVISIGKQNEDKKYASSLNLGYTFRGKERDFNQFQYNFVPQNSNTLIVTPDNIQSFFTSTNFNAGNYYVIGERERASNVLPSTYGGSLLINSPSISLEHNFKDKLNILFGSRADLINQQVVWDVVSTSPVKGSITFDKFKLLPFLNAKYKLNENHNLKFAFSKTYTLPQFKELAPFLYLDINTFNSQGNPYLYSSDNYNIDLKWEFFPTKSELISIAGFGKWIQNPINKVFIASSTSNTMSYVNSGELAQVYGLELEIKKNLINRMENADSTKMNYKLQGGFNVSYLYSTQDLSNTKVAQETKNNFSTIFNSNTSSLQGAAPLVMNADITYSLKMKNYEPSFSLVANYFNDRLFVIGYQGVGNIYERGVISLDFISRHTFSSKYNMSFSIKNILNPSIDRYQEYKDQEITVSSFKRGLNASVGFNYNF